MALNCPMSSLHSFSYLLQIFSSLSLLLSFSPNPLTLQAWHILDNTRSPDSRKSPTASTVPPCPQTSSSPTPPLSSITPPSSFLPHPPLTQRNPCLPTDYNAPSLWASSSSSSRPTRESTPGPPFQPLPLPLPPLGVLTIFQVWKRFRCLLWR